MPGDDADDERAGGPLPSPAERSWVHPSEMTAFVAASRPAPPPRTRIFGALGVIAAVMAAGLLAAFLARAPREAPTAVRATPTPAPVDKVAASVVRVVALSDAGEHVASGVAIGEGQILTSTSVVEGSAAITVIVAGGRQIAATKKGSDAVTDLALLQVPGGGVPAIKLGSSHDLDSGQRIIGVAASDRGQWIDVGRVSGFDRAFESASGPAVPGVLETDLDARPRHAGGALVDRDGKLVGVLLVPPGAETSGYVMPIDDAMKVALELEATGRARHGWMGVSVADSTERSGGGAGVEQVVPDSPAEKAGIEQGDVIVEIADETGTTAIGNRDKLMAEVRRRRPGEHLEVTLYRGGGQRNATVILRDRPDLPVTTGAAAPEPGAS
jgi:putative serine protease PepD